MEKINIKKHIVIITALFIAQLIAIDIIGLGIITLAVRKHDAKVFDSGKYVPHSKDVKIKYKKVIVSNVNNELYENYYTRYGDEVEFKYINNEVVYENIVAYSLIGLFPSFIVSILLIVIASLRRFVRSGVFVFWKMDTEYDIAETLWSIYGCALFIAATIAWIRTQIY